jgi:hypothetical protein
VLVNSNELIDPWVILNIDSNIFIANQQGEQVIEVYNAHGRKINSLIGRGSKKDNIAMVGSLQHDVQRHLLYVYDLFEKKILSIPIGEIISDKKVNLTLMVDFKTWKIPTDDLGKAYILDTSLVLENYSSAGRILFFDKNGTNIGGKIPFPKADSKISDVENAKLYASQITTNPAGDKLAIITYNAGLMNLYSIKNHDLLPIWSDTSFLPSEWKRITIANTTRIAFTPESTAGYLDVCATKDFVFALFSGKKIKENYKFSNTIQVVSWDGKKKSQLLLNRMIKRLSVSQDNSQIFAIASNEKEEPEIVSFDIKNLLN